jgi:hypothetical protein
MQMTYMDTQSTLAIRLSLLVRDRPQPQFREEVWNPETMRYELRTAKDLTDLRSAAQHLSRRINFIKTYLPTLRLQVR